MIKSIFILIILSATNFAHVTFALCDATNMGQTSTEFLADCASDSQNAVSSDYGTGTDGVRELVKKIAERIIQFGALFAIGAIVYSGMRYTTSIGDDEKIKGAKNTTLYAIVGLIILLTAFPFVDVIIGFIYGLGS